MYTRGNIIKPSHLIQSFDEIRRASHLGGSTILPMPKEMHRRAMNKRAEDMAMGPMGGAISRMAPSMWSPMLQLTSMILPRTLEEKNLWRRWYYQHDPIVGTSIDMHTRFPISQFRLVCEDDPEGSIAEEFEEICEDINLFSLLLRIGKEYYITGEAFPFGVWNDDNLAWDAFFLMNPDFLDVQINPFAQRDANISIVKWSPHMRAIVANGPDHPRTGYVYRHMAESSADILECIKMNLPYQLAPMAISHICNRSNDFDTRGTSIIDRIFKVLVYQDKLQTAQMAGAERYATPTELWKLGDAENFPDEDAFSQFEAVLRNTWTSPQKAIIWDHTVSGEIISGASGLLPLPPEFDWINKEKFMGLVMNESILTNNGPTYASASVAMDYMTSWYATYRQELEDWVKRNVFEPVARARGYYKVPKKEIIGGYRDKTVKRRPNIPKIVWDKASLRDDYQKIQQLISMQGEGKASLHRIYEMLNIDYDTEQETIKKELVDLQKIQAIMGQSGAGMGAGGGMAGGMGGGMPMGGGDMGGMPVEEGGGLPPSSTGPDSPGGTTMPPESVGAPPGVGPAGQA